VATSSDRELVDLTVSDLVKSLRSEAPEKASPYCEELIRRFEPLLRSLWRRISFKAEYEDFVQDVFVRFFANFHRLKNPSAFPGYFRQVAFSVLVDYTRRDRRGSTEPIDEAKLVEITTQMDEAILAGLLATTYLERLPIRERTILFMEYVEGFQLTEIAKFLGLTPQHVRTLKYRSLQQLRSLIVEDTVPRTNIAEP